eukprot:g1106.t1
MCPRVMCHDGKRVHRLLLHKMNMRGTLPREIGLFEELQVLGLLEKNLTGTIPAEIGQLSWLEMLYVGDNALRGTIPASIGALVALEHLHLANNRLHGSLPGSLAKLTDLASLHLANNTFTGELLPALNFDQFGNCDLPRPSICCSLAGGNRFNCPLPPQAVVHCDVGEPQCSPREDAPPTDAARQDNFSLDKRVLGGARDEL